jgi:hypothetical protein
MRDEAAMSEIRKSEGYSSTTGTGYIVCPFFIAHEKKAIFCEGLIEHTKNAIVFDSDEDKKFHQKTYCENKCTRCEIYLSVSHWKWPEE